MSRARESLSKATVERAHQDAEKQGILAGTLIGPFHSSRSWKLPGGTPEGQMGKRFYLDEVFLGLRFGAPWLICTAGLFAPWDVTHHRVPLTYVCNHIPRGYRHTYSPLWGALHVRVRDPKAPGQFEWVRFYDFQDQYLWDPKHCRSQWYPSVPPSKIPKRSGRSGHLSIAHGWRLGRPDPPTTDETTGTQLDLYLPHRKP